MYRIESVSHGNSNDLNQPHGDCVNGTYPSGGTHENTLPWRRLCVIRFTTSPSQNTGMEIPISPMIITVVSIAVPLNTPASRPMTMEAITQITVAPKTSDRVTGAAWVTWGITFAPRFTYEVRSRVMKSFFIISAYRTGSGRSRPKSCRTAL